MALVFNGTTGYAEIPLGYDNLSGQANASISFWGKASSLSSPMWIATKSKATNAFFALGNTASGLIFGTAGSYVTMANQSLATSTWIHFLLIQKSGRSRIWINGLPEFSANQGAFATFASQTLYLGRYDSGSPYYLSGSMYDVRTWSRALTPWECRKVWAGQSVTTSMTGCWTLNESSGITFADAAGGKTGNLFTGTSWDGDVPTYGTLESYEVASASGNQMCAGMHGGMR